MWHDVEVMTAMVTPFAADGSVDPAAARRLAAHLADHGSDAILVAGTTGESPTLSHEEKLSLFDVVKEAVGERIKVVAGTGSNDTAATIDLSRKAEEIGVDALLLVTPYYNKPPQRGLVAHFSAVARSVRLPIILYNVPGRTGVNMSPETVEALAEEPNIIGVKEAGGSLEQASEIVRRVGKRAIEPAAVGGVGAAALSRRDDRQDAGSAASGRRPLDAADFHLWSGDDSLTLPMLAVGGTGVISVASHLVGREIKEMIRHFREGRVETAQSIHERLLPFFKACFLTSNPIPIKGALALAGLASERVRPPLVELTADERDRLREAMLPLGLLRQGSA